MQLFENNVTAELITLQIKDIIIFYLQRYFFTLAFEKTDRGQFYCCL